MNVDPSGWIGRRRLRRRPAALGEYLRRRERDPRGASPTQVPDADSRRGKMGTDSCDVAGAAFFVAALVAGTGCTICSKALFQV